MYINHVKLETLVKKIFEAGGCNSIEASAISYHLVLANLVGPSYQTYFVYSESLKNDRRLEVFREFLYNEAKDWNY